MTCGLCPALFGQDPHYSQFFMAPQQLNPATAATMTGPWRLVSNYRQQWGNAGTAFTTYSVAFDGLLSGDEEDRNRLAFSLSLMRDQSLNGAFKSIYASAATAYQVQFNERHQLALGIQGSYGNRRLDFQQLSFGSQFSSRGFDLSLPSGETALSAMRPVYSINTGLAYGYRAEYLNLDFGVAVFHINRPLQTFLDDPRQQMPVRYVAHGNLEYDLSRQLVLTVNAQYQQQSSQSYLAAGGALGMDLTGGERNKIFYLGAWYRQDDAIYPYTGLLFGHLQIGLSYDITLSKQNKGPGLPQSFEMSLVIRPVKKNPGVIPCPWK